MKPCRGYEVMMVLRRMRKLSNEKAMDVGQGALYIVVNSCLTICDVAIKNENVCSISRSILCKYADISHEIQRIPSRNV